MTDTPILSADGWTMRARRGSAAPPQRVLVLLHGWSGNEDVMWIFTRQIPADYWIISPRGPVKAPEGGFGWFPSGEAHIPNLDDIKPVIAQVISLVDSWAQSNEINSNQFALMGFSQGAILAYAVATLYPERISGIAALAGYLPENWQGERSISSLASKPIYVAHGNQDTTIPVAYARQTVQFLERTGADVTYCESDVGHKLSINCLHGLAEFMAGLPPSDQ